MPTRNATRKKLQRKFRVGDVVTWGSDSTGPHLVVDVTSRGVVVECVFGKPDKDGRRTALVEFAPGSKSWRCPGPPRLTNAVGRCGC